MISKEFIIIHGHELPVIIGAKGGGYIEVDALCRASGLYPPKHIAKLKEDPKAYAAMRILNVKKRNSRSYDKHCLPLRMVLEDFFGSAPLARSTSGYITRKELLRLYGFL